MMAVRFGTWGLQLRVFGFKTERGSGSGVWV